METASLPKMNFQSIVFTESGFNVEFRRHNYALISFFAKYATILFMRLIFISFIYILFYLFIFGVKLIIGLYSVVILFLEKGEDGVGIKIKITTNKIIKSITKQE